MSGLRKNMGTGFDAMRRVYSRTYFYSVRGKDYHCIRKGVCSEKCLKEHEDSLIYEVYKGQNIYKVGDRYMPYLGCNYYYESVEGARQRIDNPTLIPLTPGGLSALADIMRG